MVKTEKNPGLLGFLNLAHLLCDKVEKGYHYFLHVTLIFKSRLWLWPIYISFDTFLSILIGENMINVEI